MDKDKDDPASRRPQGHEFVVFFSVGNITLRHYRLPSPLTRFHICDRVGRWVLSR